MVWRVSVKHSLSHTIATITGMLDESCTCIQSKESSYIYLEFRVTKCEGSVQDRAKFPAGTGLRTRFRFDVWYHVEGGLFQDPGFCWSVIDRQQKMEAALY